jgi:signal transduction histidine kinase
VDDGQVEFSVENPGQIPPDIGARLFHRSFSTKGSGRGLGTYSVKLFTERYLGGKVSFHSSPEGGTVFTVRCPLTLPDRHQSA